MDLAVRKIWIVLLVTLITSTSLAAGTVIPTGSWGYAGGKEQVAEMERAVDQSVDEMSFVMRPFARPKLKEICAPWTSVKIARDGENVSVTTDKGTLSSPLGKTVKRTIDGDVVSVRRDIKNGVLVARVWTDEGGRRNTFRQVGGKLVVKSTISAPQLPKPVTFRFTYE